MSWLVLTGMLIALARASSQQTSALALPTALVLLTPLAGPFFAVVRGGQLARRVRAKAISLDNLQHEFAQLETAALSLWLMGAALFSFGTRAPALSVWGLAHYEAWGPLLATATLVLPLVMTLQITWLGLFQVEQAYGEVKTAAAKGRKSSRRGAYLWEQTRRTLLPILVPACVMLVWQAVWSQPIPLSLGSTEVTQGSAANSLSLPMALPAMGTILLLAPLLLRQSWPATTLAASPLRTELELLFQQQGCRVREIFIWQTNRQVFNAVVTGLSGWLRYLFLTDGLLAELSDAQVLAVARHEVAHLTRYHLPLRLLGLALPLAIWQTGLVVWPSLGEVISTAGLIGWEAAGSLVLIAATMAYALFVVGAYGKLLEYDADLAVVLRGPQQPSDSLAAEHFLAALTIAQRGRPETWASRWLHPPLANRQQFLLEVLQNPTLGCRFRQRLNLVAYGLVLLYATLGLLMIGAR